MIATSVILGVMLITIVAATIINLQNEKILPRLVAPKKNCGRIATNSKPLGET